MRRIRSISAEFSVTFCYKERNLRAIWLSERYAVGHFSLYDLQTDATLSHTTVHSTRQHITRARGRGPGAGVGSSLATLG